VSGEAALDRFVGVYRVPSHVAPASARLRLDAVVRERLPSACAGALDRVAAPGDESVWMLRTIESRSVIDLARPDGELAATWAADIVEAIVRSLAAGGTGVLRFEDADAHVAAFAADLADGCAWSRWYHAPFAPLQALGTSRALREAITATARSPGGVLARLAHARRLDALELLAPSDAERVLLAAEAELGPPVAPERQLVERMAGLAPEAGLARAAERPPGAATRALLRLVGAALAALPDPASRPAIVPAARGLAALAAQRGADGDVARSRAAPVAAGSPAPASMPPAPAGGDEAWLARPERAVRPPPRLAASVLRSTIATEFGGAFLLLRGLLELPEPLRDDGALRQLLLRKCLGADAVGDEGLLLAAGLDKPPEEDALDGRDPELDARALSEWLVASGRADGQWLAADLDPFAGGTPGPAAERAWSRAAHAVLSAFARRLPGLRTSSAPFLRRNLLATAAVVRLHPERVQVAVTPPPLSILLQLSGFHGLEFDVPWLGERRLELRL
jgi:hypothetical protein